MDSEVTYRITVMFYLKGCGKCKGDLVLEEDFYGSYLRCMQCGRIAEVQTRETGVVADDVRRTEKIAA